MSSAGTPYRQSIFVVDESSAGSKTFDFLAENDACSLVIQRLSGTASVTGSILSRMPAPMTDITKTTFQVSTSEPTQIYVLLDGQGAVAVSWDGPVHLRISVKLTSASMVAATTPAPSNVAADTLALYEFKTEFERMNRSLALIIKHLSVLTEIETETETEE